MSRRLRKAGALTLVLAGAAAIGSDSLAQSIAPVAAQSPLGMNLDGITDWSTDEVFADVAAYFRRWGAVNSSYSTPITNVNADGYPLVPATATTSLASYPDGVYKLSFTGQASVAIGGIGTLSNLKTVNGVTTADVTINHAQSGTGQLTLTVTNVSAANPMANLHLMAPGYSVGQEFTTTFLQRMQPFGTIRTMDWTLTNNSTITDWSQRASPTQFSKTTYDDTRGAGVSYETIIDMANATHKDVWVNVPVTASASYIKSMADLFRDKLNPSLNVHVEYSNETWNTQFQQYNQLLTMAKGNPVITATDDFSKVAQEDAFKTKQVSDIWNAEWGSRSGKVLTVFNGQAANTWFGQQALAFLKQTYGSTSSIKEYAIAPYFGDPYSTPAIDAPGLTMDGMFAALETELQNTVVPWITTSKSLADQYGMKLVGYEGGQSLLDPANQQLKAAAQNDPRMGKLYSELIADWNKLSGGGVLNLYNYTGTSSTWGYWSALESADQHGSVKWDAILSAILKPGDSDLDGSVTYADFLILKKDWGKTGMWWQDGDFNKDGTVNLQDFTLMKPYLTGLTTAQAADITAFTGQRVTASPSAPEPASLALAGVGATMLLGRRRRRAA